MASGRILPLPFILCLFSLLLLTHRCSGDEPLKKDSLLKSFSSIKAALPLCNSTVRSRQSNQASIYIQQTRASLQKTKGVASKYPQILQIINHALDLAYRLQNFIKGKNFSRARKTSSFLEMDIRNSLRLSVKLPKSLNWKDLKSANVTAVRASSYINLLSKRCRTGISLNPNNFTFPPPSSSFPSLSPSISPPSPPPSLPPSPPPPSPPPPSPPPSPPPPSPPPPSPPPSPPPPSPPPPRMETPLNEKWTVNSSIDLDYIRVTRDDTYNLMFAGNRATYIRSTRAFKSGRFTAVLKRPEYGSGLSSDFSLEFVKYGNTTLRIAFDYPGNRPGRFYTKVFDGSNFRFSTFDAADDGTADYHSYTIEWTKNLARFYFDDDWVKDFDLTTMNFTDGLQMNAIVRIQPPQEWGLGSLNLDLSPFILSMKSFSFLSPLAESQFLPVPKLPSSPLLRVISIDYCADFMGRNGNDYYISWVSYCGSRFRSLYTYTRGRFTAFLKCADGNTSGLLSAFYTSSKEGSKDMDEIDFEFLGNKKFHVQTNFYVNGAGGRERLVPLGFDCSLAYHNYTIVWTPNFIAWYVDSQRLRLEINDLVSPFPTKPAYAYASLWDASFAPWWVGSWSGANSPYFFRLRNITVDPNV